MKEEGKMSVTREQAITDLLESIAMEGVAIGKILDIQGEKIQKFLALDNVEAEVLLQLNESVANLIDTVTILESMLESKLEIIYGTRKRDQQFLQDMNK